MARRTRREAPPTNAEPIKVMLVFDVPPSLNRMYNRTRQGGVRLSDEARNYKAHVSAVAYNERVEMLQGEVCLELIVYRKQRKGDIDNYLKVLLDSLNGIVWKDDKQIVRIVAERRDDKRNPRVEVTVTGVKAS